MQNHDAMTSEADYNPSLFSGLAIDMHYSKLFVSLIFASQITTFVPAMADDASGTAAGAAAPSATTMQKGNVVKAEVTLNDLRDARLSVSRVRKAAANLYDEVTRQQMTMSYNPNVVGTSVIMTPRPTFDGPSLPPRKKWVDASMAEIGPEIKLFKEDVDAAIESNRRTDVSTDARNQLDPIRDEAFEIVNKSFAEYTYLEKLTAGPNYDNGAIASTVQGLNERMKQLDKSLKKAIRILQKEAKSAKRA